MIKRDTYETAGKANGTKTTRPEKKRAIAFAMGWALFLSACAIPAASVNAGSITINDAQSASANPSSRSIDDWFDARWQEYVELRPTLATRLRIDGDHGSFSDLKAEGETALIEWYRTAAVDLQSRFDYERLSPSQKISYDIFLFQLEDAETAYRHRDFAYQFSHLGGTHTWIPNFLINLHRVETRDDWNDYLARLADGAMVMDEMTQRAADAAQQEIRAPRYAYAAAKDQAARQIKGQPFEKGSPTPLLADGVRKIQGLVDAGILSQEDAEFEQQRLEEVLLQDLGPSYQRFNDWLDFDVSNAPETGKGATSFSGGAAYYEDRLRSATTTSQSAEVLHQIGLREVKALRQEMAQLIEAIGYERSLTDFFDYMRDDPKFYYPNTDDGRAAYLSEAETVLRMMQDQLPRAFETIPTHELQVRRVPPEREIAGGPQHYMAGSPDRVRPGTYFIHLSDMSTLPWPQLEVIAYHEGVPGHHLQVSIAQTLTGIPRFRTQTFFTAYSEGWALYAEGLAKELGGYSDPYSDFGRLTTEMWRAIRLVVDTGIHHMGWSEAQAVAFFLENSPMPEQQVIGEVRRYVIAPGQATAYTVGLLHFEMLRERARTKLGPSYRDHDFHEVVLCGGAMPLSLVERRVDAWLANPDSLGQFQCGLGAGSG
jgi:uncharacterized protein (DUF885 family)